MSAFQILHSWTSAVLFECEIGAKHEGETREWKLGFAIKAAVKARANLAGADLAGAYLADAYLVGADLAGAYLADAYLVGANLARAYLAGADLAGADLAGANLADADLAGANLARANLADADLAGANLARANLAGAYLAGANLAGANLADADLAGANLAGANLVDGGQRSDGYRFVGSVKEGVLMIGAGCRYFTIDQAREHWQRTRGDTPLGDETTAILDHIERVAAVRGLVPAKEPV